MSLKSSISERPTKRCRLVSDTDNDAGHYAAMGSESESMSDVDSVSTEGFRGSVNDDGGEDDVCTDSEELFDDATSNFDTDRHDTEESDDDTASAKTPECTENWNDPLYRNARITLGQSVLLVMAFAVTVGLTQTGCSELLTMLTMFLPMDSLLPTTKYMLKKYFQFKPESVILQFYCPDCCSLLSDVLLCTGCNIVHDRKVLDKNHNFFMYLPMLPQLLNLLETRGFGAKLRTSVPVASEDGFGDICDGKHYANLMNGVLLKDANSLSLTFNTDGVPLFKSSSVSIWTLQSFINELPVQERKANFLLSGLWFGSGKPVLTTFLKPFTNELQHLGSVGFEWIKKGTQVKSFVYAIACCCDSVARAMLQNIMQFNGMYGCSWCTSPGETVKKGKGFVRAYKFDPNIVLRKDSDIRECAKKAHISGKAVLGVKGPSPLSLLPGFDMVKGFVVDYMHSVDLGVTRQLGHLWFDSVYHAKPWYLGKRIAEIDSKLLSMLPPSNITRAPRSLSARAYWKANEWRAFLLCYAPIVLKEILPLLYYNHMILLSSVMYSLQSEFISHLDEFYASTSINKFVEEFSVLYGLEHMSYNVHLMVHLTDCVRNWGPLWCYSAYSFESANGLFLKLFHGTQAVQKQIANSFLLLQRIQELIPVSLNDKTHEYVIKILSSVLNNSKFYETPTGAKLLGASVNRFVNFTEKLQIELALGLSVQINVQSHMKAIINKQLYHSDQYTRINKRCNCTVTLKDGTAAVITEFLKVTNSISKDISFVVLVKSIRFDTSLVLHERNKVNCFHVQFVETVSNSIKAVKPSEISRKCVVHKVNGCVTALAQLPNNLEND